MSRLVSAGTIAYAQADFFQPKGSINRLPGIVAASLGMTVFANSSVLAWPILDGGGVPNSGVSAGSVYFEEISGAPGFYLVRFFPDRVGFWRIVLSYPALQQEVPLEFDVVPANVFKAAAKGGLTASFDP